METGGDKKSNANMGTTGPATNTCEHEFRQTSPLTEQGHGSTNNNLSEAHSSALGNNPGPPSSLSQNPFLVPGDATNNTSNESMNYGHSSTHLVGSQSETHHSSNNDMLTLHSSYESSQGNPFHEPTNANNKVHFGAIESWQNQPSAIETVPSTNVESHNRFQVTEQGPQGMANNNFGTSFSPASESSSQEHIQDSINKSQTDTNAPPKLVSDSHIAAESSDDDMPIKSKPKHAGVVAGQHSASIAPGPNGEVGTNKGSEIQNPPVQMMERPGESGSTSQYVFPSHVFARNSTNAPVEWSTASNESLFSIYMGNTSFSSELACFKSCELDKPGDVSLSDPTNASPSNQPPAPVNKFNDMNPRTCELHGDSSKATEAKAAETMREVIMESSRTTENAAGKGDDKNSNSHRQSDGSAQSYAFQTSTDGDKSVSSKGNGEKQKQQEQSEQKEKADAGDEAPKSTTDAPPTKWINCFACCAR